MEQWTVLRDLPGRGSAVNGIPPTGSTTRPMTRSEFLRRFRLGDEAPGDLRVRGDHDLNPGMSMAELPLREAAVLVALVDRDDGLHLLFTQRTRHLAAHAGQISFPGGSTEPHDRHAEDTALRETLEEIGLSSDRIETVGRLDTYITRTGFRVTPVVALVQPPFELAPDPVEVDEVFEVPLDVILDPALPQQMSRELFGAPRYFYAFPYGDRFIWGATAGMLVNLRDVLAG